MREAGVDLVSVGVFSWALLEPAAGQFDFDWLDRGPRHCCTRAGSRVDLATATASPPPWLTRAHPEILPVRADGRPPLARRPAGLVPQLADVPRALAPARASSCRALRRPPAVVLWHVEQRARRAQRALLLRREAAAFRDWLRDRYATSTASTTRGARRSGASTTATGRRSCPPRVAPTFPNPTQQLDFHRFSLRRAAWTAAGRARRAPRAHPRHPGHHELHGCMELVTQHGLLRHWAARVDLVSNDHYLDAADSGQPRRALVRCRPHPRPRVAAAVVLMEHSTSAVNWQPRNIAKVPGQMRRNSLAHVARGSDAVLFFQWRRRAAGAEKFHSALLPHAGTDTKVWREVCAARRASSGASREVAGSDGRATTSRWSSTGTPGGRAELDTHPTSDLSLPRPVAGALPAPVGPRDRRRHRRARRRPVRLPARDRPDALPDHDAETAARRTPVRRTPAARFWSPTGAASSTSTTTSGSAATPAPSATCSACAREEFFPLREGERVSLR